MRDSPSCTTDRTPERSLEFRPSFPIPGPNGCALVRCAADRVDALVDEVESAFGSRGLPFYFKLDDGTQPPDLAARLERRGYRRAEELACLALPPGVDVAASRGLEVVDALESLDRFLAAEAVAAQAFGDALPGGGERRFEEARADPARRVLLALLEGRPVGAGAATVLPEGTVLNGGAVVPAARGRGVYRSLVAERVRLARAASSAGVATYARTATSLPILLRMGFRRVGTILLYGR